MRYTYFYIEPACKPPFRKRVRYTLGKFVRITGPMGCFGFRYALFRNRASEVLIPVHDLTDETREAISKLTENN